MKKYKVEIKEYLQRIIDVEAESEEDAVDKVIKEYKAENIILDADDFTDVDIDIYKE